MKDLRNNNKIIRYFYITILKKIAVALLILGAIIYPEVFGAYIGIWLNTFTCSFITSFDFTISSTQWLLGLLTIIVSIVTYKLYKWNIN